MKQTIIQAVRVAGLDNTSVDHPWDPSTWYIVRDDCPHLDILTIGYQAQAKGDTRFQLLDEPAPEGGKWQRWDLETELARSRRLGEVSVPLKVPKGHTLRCYIIPSLLLNYRDVFAIVEDIEAELKIAAAWDTVAERPERSWSRLKHSGTATRPSELAHLVRDELRSALAHHPHLRQRSPPFVIAR